MTARPRGNDTASPHEPSSTRIFLATAYCLPGRTASGSPVGPGVIAADPEVLPLGSIVRLVAGRYSGTYTVLDTGAKVRGHMVDIWMPSKEEARRFGVRRVKLQVLRHGWKGSSRGGTIPFRKNSSRAQAVTGSTLRQRGAR
ncbi:MAG TPA: 3D domain-containing protein [Blastocatellia bacterium]|nr:3D domain-containing protein [Blastocatellia bacterium]